MIGEASVTDHHYGEPLSCSLCSLRSFRSLGSSRSFLEPRRRSLRRSRGPRRPPPPSVPLSSGRRRLPRRRLRRSTPIASAAAVAADPRNTRGCGASLELGAAASLAASTWSFVVFQQREGGDISSVRPFGRAEVAVVASAGQVALAVVVLVMAENEKRGEAALSNETTRRGWREIALF